jgi:hypothetical protein
MLVAFAETNSSVQFLFKGTNAGMYLDVIMT